MRTLIFLFSFSLLAGDIPLQDYFWKLTKQPNVVGVNDCTNKCGRYVKALGQKGITGKIVILELSNEDLHAVVRLPNGLYVDPTFGRLTHDLSEFGEYVFTIKNIEHLNSAEFL